MIESLLQDFVRSVEEILFHGKEKNKLLLLSLVQSCSSRVLLAIVAKNMLLDESGFNQGGPMFFLLDSRSVIKLAKNLVYLRKTKHVEVDCQHIHQHSHPSLYHSSTQQADDFTKSH